ncbi:beta-ketoacyl synthase chain length factor [Telluria aromaticivorans]|uniref:Beta-ketoacyl synthase chain length factor n=1 Tax=Telluria aromaticivorans TaxID=2725995 RepID=A0A7Y2JVN3_9BURK|nr:beta-ketoacyl synthase chain length factor [Telluria aromaticivorans]NNG21877.1 beta-ketoacyl synthase chain length factor [Telluria aromaticivorans]
MSESEVVFSIARHAAWAPGLATHERWTEWAAEPWPLAVGEEPKVAAMPPMLRRRAGFLGRMALEVAYECLGEARDVPTVFCSRHGEVARAIDLLGDLARGEPLSPTGFGLAVHNASAGLFSIARGDRANHVALAAGAASIEHAVIEACGQLLDGAPMVLLVVCDTPLPALLEEFEDCDEQPFAFAWAMVPAAGRPVRLSWSAAQEATASRTPGGLEILRFHHQGAPLVRHAGGKRWTWSRDA